MPRDGETPLARFAHALARDAGLTIGTPWLSDDGSAAILPILRTLARPRRYILANEASDSVSAVDPGRIDRIEVRNDAAVPIFLPPGALFRSDDTASRGNTAGVVIGPRSNAVIDVKCVHGSHPIAAGAVLTLDPEIAPNDVCRALLSRDQGRVWAVVSDFVGAPRAPQREERLDARSPAASDDLVAALAGSRSAGQASDEAPSEIVAQPGQCGVVILAAEGIAAVECFDSPDSWKAAARLVLRRQTRWFRPTVRSPWTIALDPAGAVRTAKEFLAKLGEIELRRVAPSSWVAGDFSLECTSLGGELIHLIVFGGKESAEHHPASAEIPSSAATPAEEGTDDLPWSGPQTMAGTGTDGAEVAAAEVAAVNLREDPEPSLPPVRPRRRKVLTSGWDGPTFTALEHYTHKEFRGDRSAAMRFLVRHGLRSRGYLGPMPSNSHSSVATSAPVPDMTPPSAELGRAGVEARLGGLERIAETRQYAAWLRKRARLELERMASTLEDEPLRAAAQSALDRLSPIEPIVETPELIEVVPPPPPPPVDVRPVLRQAFAASAGGDYRQSLGLFDQVLEADPDNRTARLGRAVAFRRAGKTQEALADLDAVLYAEPRNAAALLARGRILQGQGDLAGALASFDLLVEVAANDWDVWMARADLLAKMGRNEDALRSYREALRRKPEDQDLQVRIRTLEVVRAPAVPKTLARPSPPPGIEEGQSYLVKEARRERALSLFRALASRKIPSLVLTGRSRDLVRREVGVAGVRIVGLGHTPGEDVHQPTALASLTRTIERFVEDNQGRGVVLLDGLGELVAGNGFRDTILFVEHLNEAILQSRAILLVSVAPDAFPEKEVALLERSLRILS